MQPQPSRFTGFAHLPPPPPGVVRILPKVIPASIAIAYRLPLPPIIHTTERILKEGADKLRRADALIALRAGKLSVDEASHFTKEMHQTLNLTVLPKEPA